MPHGVRAFRTPNWTSERCASGLLLVQSHNKCMCWQGINVLQYFIILGWMPQPRMQDTKTNKRAVLIFCLFSPLLNVDSIHYLTIPIDILTASKSGKQMYRLNDVLWCWHFNGNPINSHTPHILPWNAVEVTLKLFSFSQSISYFNFYFLLALLV